MNIVLTFLSGLHYPIYIPKHIYNVDAHLSLSFKIISNLTEYKYYSNSQFTFHFIKKEITIGYEEKNPLTFEDIDKMYNENNIIAMVIVKPLIEVPFVAEKYARMMHFDEFQRSFIEEDFTRIRTDNGEDKDKEDEDIEDIETYKIYWINYDKKIHVLQLYRFYIDTNKCSYTNLYISNHNKIKSFSHASYTEAAKRRFAAILRLVISEYASKNENVVESSRKFLTLLE